MVVRFYDSVADSLLRFSVIIAKSQDKWVLCKHKNRTTYEFPGGMREVNESILETAKRELYEETGAIVFDIKPISLYSYANITNSTTEEMFGMLYFADIQTFDEKLHYEIESIILSNTLDVNWTYNDIMPQLLEETKRRKFI